MSRLAATRPRPLLLGAAALLAALGGGCRSDDGGIALPGDADPGPPGGMRGGGRPIHGSAGDAALPPPANPSPAPDAAATVDAPVDWAAALPPDAAVERSSAPAPVVDARVDRMDAAGPPDLRVDSLPAISTGCEILVCEPMGGEDCCNGWYHYGLDTPAKMQAVRHDLVKSFTRAANAVSADFGFDAVGQNGAIAVNLSPPRAVKSLKLTARVEGAAGQAPFVTLEKFGGSAGCAYDLSAAGEANFGKALFCWGPSFTPGAASVRVAARSAGTVKLVITRLEVR